MNSQGLSISYWAYTIGPADYDMKLFEFTDEKIMMLSKNGLYMNFANTDKNGVTVYRNASLVVTFSISGILSSIGSTLPSGRILRSLASKHASYK